MLVTRYQIRNINTVSTLKQLLQFNQHTFNDYGCDNLRFKAIQCMEVDFTSFASLLKQCTKTKAVAQGKIAHAYIIKTGFQQEVFVGNNLINLYAKCALERGKQVMLRMDAWMMHGNSFAKCLNLIR
ncbi:hypothetical protein SUGI_0572400 [Cryptomeria japonica]|nr:hypothetical protein SUGI_0572400 [Cryptomeria japonica]